MAQSESARPRRSSWGGRIGLSRLTSLCHDVATGLYAGVDIVRVVATEASRGSRRHRQKMEEVRQRVAQGDSLTEAFIATGGYFPPLVCEMLQVGEQSGRLERVLFQLSEHYDHLLRLRRWFLIGIAWPMIELSLGLFVIGLLIWILGAIGAEWEGKPLGVFGLRGSEGLVTYVSIVGSVVAAVVLLILAVQRGMISLDPLYRLLIHIPGIGTGLRTMAMSRMTWALGMASDSDIDTQKVVELSVRSTENSYYTSKIDTIKSVVRRGGELHEAFRTAGVFPVDFLNTLETGEMSGRISESMMVLAREYEDRAKHYFKALTVAAGVLVFLLVAGLMIFMIFNLFMNLYFGPIQDTLDAMP